MSIESPPESVSCPSCGDDVIFSGNAPEWCPQCGARLQETSVVKARWKNAAMTLISCALSAFGGLGSCALVIYGFWRFSQTTFGASSLAVLVVFLIVARVIGIIRRLLYKQ
ncbi:MAG TPA: hypothetical protein VM821_04805 [Abditibacteriaceae bacterium]|jgi:hypothetical protein|nr:hypothetical protein [Abditibacteriaceae bacterium]